MPFQSEKQRKYLWANEPAIAKRWEKYPKGYNTGGVSHLFRSKEDRTGFNKGTEKKDGTNLIIWGKSVIEQWPNLNESQKDYIRKHWPQHVPEGHAQGGYIRPEEDGVLGLADGGNIRLQPHTASDLLVQKISSGERPKYQPPGYSGPSGQETRGDTRGRDEPHHGDVAHGPGGRFDPAPEPVSKPDTSRDDDRPDPHGGDWELGWLDKSLRPGTEEYMLKEKYDDEGDRGYYGQKKIQYEEKVLTDKTNQYILDNLQQLDPTKYYEDMNAFKKFYEVGKSIPTPTVLGLLKALYDEHKLTSEGKGILDDWKKYVGGPPGSNPEAYDALWLALEKRKAKYRYKDEEERDGDKTTTTIEEDAIKYPTQEEMMAASLRALEMLYGDRRSAQIPEDRNKQMAYYNAYKNKYMSAKGGRVPGYNTGGLSNLFRLKNK